MGFRFCFHAESDSSINVICNRNQKAFVILTALLPQPRDQPTLIKTASYSNQYMSQMVAHAEKIEFSRPGKHLIMLGKCLLEYFNKYSSLNEQGLDLIHRGLEAKFHCAKLFVKFDEQNCDSHQYN